MNSTKTKHKKIDKDDVVTGFMLLPAILFLCVCSIYPFIWIFRYVAYDYNGFNATFTGLKNFERMLNDTTFWNSITTTFEYAFYKLITVIPLSLFIAVLLNSKYKGANVFRGIYFMPTIISTSIAGMIFSFIFATKNGILNEILMLFHLTDSPIKWLTSMDWVMFAIILVSIWGGLGNYMLYFSSGINSINEDVYESAKIDGANSTQTFFFVTLPMLAPVLKVVLMLAITSAFKDYESIMVLTQGGPGNRSQVMFLYIYTVIFGSSNSSAINLQIGYGALLSIVAALIIGLVTAIYLFVSKKLDNIV